MTLRRPHFPEQSQSHNPLAVSQWVLVENHIPRIHHFANSADFVQRDDLHGLIVGMEQMLDQPKVIYFGGEAAASTRAGYLLTKVALAVSFGAVYHCSLMELPTRIFSGDTATGDFINASLVFIHGVDLPTATSRGAQTALNLLTEILNPRYACGRLTLLSGPPWAEAVNQLPPALSGLITDYADVDFVQGFTL